MRRAVDGIPASRLLCMKCFSAAPSRVRSTNEECPLVREKDENRTGTKVPDGSEVAGPLIPVVDAERENLQLDDHSLPTDSAAPGDLANFISFVAFRTGSCYRRWRCYVCCQKFRLAGGRIATLTVLDTTLTPHDTHPSRVH